MRTAQPEVRGVLKTVVTPFNVGGGSGLARPDIPVIVTPSGANYTLTFPFGVQVITGQASADNVSRAFATGAVAGNQITFARFITTTGAAEAGGGTAIVAVRDFR